MTTRMFLLHQILRIFPLRFKSMLKTVDKPGRMAMIESSMFGIPFQGYDYYRDGKGGMRGVIAKQLT